MPTQNGRPHRPLVWIDDGNPIFRKGLGAVLHSEGMRVAGESGPKDASPCLEGVEVLVFDTRAGGVQRAASLTRGSHCRLIALLHEPSEQIVMDALGAGVRSVLIRSTITTRGLVTAIHSVQNDTASIPVDLMAQLVDQVNATRPKVPHRLNEREVDVLRYLSEGRETREIAESLGYSERTVKNVVHDLLMKMNCRNRAHAVATAARVGLI